ncbi:MAG TPA: hypothetical protein VMT68_08270 [Caulobacteraceae bacterium]|nr:hypothetical protein [Caulobacteraceae bacterium]
MDSDGEGWIAGERPEDGQIRRVGEDRYEFHVPRYRAKLARFLS